MSGLLLALTAIGVLNPGRARLGLPERSDRGLITALGAVVVFAAVWVVAGASGPILDALEISDETFRIAAGIVIMAAGVRSVFRPQPGEEPVLEGWRAALWPIAFPRLFTPELAVLALTAGSQEGVGATMASIAVALVLVVGGAFLPRRDAVAGVLRWTAAILGVVLVITGTVLIIDGVRDV